MLDRVQTIENILEFEKYMDCLGILLLINFEKAFNSLIDRSFLLKY